MLAIIPRPICFLETYPRLRILFLAGHNELTERITLTKRCVPTIAKLLPICKGKAPVVYIFEQSM